MLETIERILALRSLPTTIAALAALSLFACAAPANDDAQPPPPLLPNELVIRMPMPLDADYSDDGLVADLPSIGPWGITIEGTEKHGVCEAVVYRKVHSHEHQYLYGHTYQAIVAAYGPATTPPSDWDASSWEHAKAEWQSPTAELSRISVVAYTFAPQAMVAVLYGTRHQESCEAAAR